MTEFNKENGTDIVRVPFKGGGDTVNSMLTGTTQIAVFGIGNLLPFIRSGKIIRPGDRQRHPFIRLRPISRHSRRLGIKQHILATSFGIYAPAGTPKPMIDKLYRIILAVACRKLTSSRNS